MNMQVGKFSKIKDCADWNKVVQAGIFVVQLFEKIKYVAQYKIVWLNYQLDLI